MRIIEQLKKRGHISLAKKIEKVMGGGWNTFFDPLTKQHIIKTGRLPGKEKKKKHEVSSDVFGDDVSNSTTIDPVQSIQPKQNGQRFVLRRQRGKGDYKIPNKVFKDSSEESSSASSNASLDHIRGENEEDEIITQYMKKVGDFYKQRKKNFNI
jgi:hypothetical protein